jgi:hypothetical protein
MPGLDFNAAALNNQAGLLVQSAWTSLEECRRFKLWLDDAIHTDAILQASPYNVASGDLSVIRASFNDLGGTNGLWAVARGTYTPTGANNYFFNAKKLTGLQYSA